MGEETPPAERAFGGKAVARLGLRRADCAAMRLACVWLTVLCMLPGGLHGQFKSTGPLVIAPTTVTDAKGRYVDGLAEEDLALYDNNVRQAVHRSEEHTSELQSRLHLVCRLL